MMTDESVDFAMAVLPNATHVLIEETGHDLGLDTWEINPLLKVIVGFLETLD
jgi:hypothetical protein